MEEHPEYKIDKSTNNDRYYKPNYSILFKKIKDIQTPVKNDLIIALMDGNWHSESDLVRLAKRQQYRYMGIVTLGTMVNSLNHLLKSNYVEKKIINSEMCYKISDNYIGLTRAAYNRNLSNLI
ncbi:MAG: hypothetical protein EU540_07485 [Promethearchaeota archaeon]|nr:MAG: hypothetical protein EU540_07485 [Candidatus Lokiarchaeota archaeon]